MKKTLLFLLLSCLASCTPTFAQDTIRIKKISQYKSRLQFTDSDIVIGNWDSAGVQKTRTWRGYVLKNFLDSNSRNVDSIWRIPAKDSIYFSINGLQYEILDSIPFDSILVAGSNITLTRGSGTITIAASGGGGGGVDTTVYPTAGAASNYGMGGQINDTAKTLLRKGDTNAKGNGITPYYLSQHALLLGGNTMGATVTVGTKDAHLFDFTVDNSLFASFDNFSKYNVIMGGGNAANSALTYCILIGNGAGATGSSTTDMIAIGVNALELTTGNHNVGIGMSAGSSNSTGTNNVFLGYSSGANNTTQSNNTYLGVNTNISVSATNVIAIGEGAVVGQSNQTVIGNSSMASIITGAGLCVGDYVLQDSVIFGTAIKMTDSTTFHSNVLLLNISGCSGTAGNDTASVDLPSNPPVNKRMSIATLDNTGAAEFAYISIRTTDGSKIQFNNTTDFYYGHYGQGVNLDGIIPSVTYGFYFPITFVCCNIHGVKVWVQTSN